jgi:toxin HigB-1
MPRHARDLGDLRSSPDNGLEALAGDRRGRHSIRINDQWRICFTWTEARRERGRAIERDVEPRAA